MDWLKLLIIIVVVVLEIIALVLRFQTKRPLANWLELLALGLFVVFSILNIGTNIDLTALHGWTNLFIIIFAVTIFVAKISFFRTH